MIRLGGTASASHMKAFQGLATHFQRRGIDLDWLQYSDYDPLVDAFVSGEVDLAWNGPVSYVKIKRLLGDGCKVIAMRDADVNFITHFVTRADSDIETVEDLLGTRFAFGSRGSVQAGLLPHYFLKQAGIKPGRDLAGFSFYEDRAPSRFSDEQDVIDIVRKGEYDAGAVSQRAIESLASKGALQRGSLRTLWSSPGYSHCCFTARSELDTALYERIAGAFLSVDGDDPVGKAVLEAEGCTALVPGIEHGWEVVEAAAEEEGLV